MSNVLKLMLSDGVDSRLWQFMFQHKRRVFYYRYVGEHEAIAEFVNLIYILIYYFGKCIGIKAADRRVF